MYGLRSVAYRMVQCQDMVMERQYHWYQPSRSHPGSCQYPVFPPPFSVCMGYLWYNVWYNMAIHVKMWLWKGSTNQAEAILARANILCSHLLLLPSPIKYPVFSFPAHSLGPSISSTAVCFYSSSWWNFFCDQDFNTILGKNDAEIMTR